MSRWIVAGLVVLNLMLGVGVYLRVMERPAQAQIGGGRGEVAVVAGNDNNNSIIYMLEATSGQLVLMRTDPINNRAEFVARRNVAEDFKQMR